MSIAKRENPAKVDRLPLLLCSCFCTLFASALNAAPNNLQNSVEKFNPATSAEALKNEQVTQPEIPAPLIKVINNKSPKFVEGAKPVKFTLKNILITGNKTFTTDELKKIYQSKLDTAVSLADIQQITYEITQYYREAGYILSQAVIPEQAIDKSGIIKIQVLEGYIDKVEVKGCIKQNVCALLERYGEHIKRAHPLNLKTLERYAFLANDIPGVEVRTVLSKSELNIGATDLFFIIKEKKYSGSVAFNDYNSVVLGRHQYLINATTYNISMASETAINGSLSRFADRLKYISLTHTQQLNSNGLGGNFSIGDIKTKPNMESIGLSDFDIPGKALIAYMGLDYAWIRSHSKNLYVGAGFNYTDSSTTFGGEDLFKDNIRSIDVYASYGFLMGSKTYNRCTLTFIQGINVLAASGNPPSRVGEKLNFSKLVLDDSLAHRFAYEKLSSYITISGQYAFNRVPSSETTSYGGILYGAGYDPSTISGDRGINGKIELQHTAFTNQNFKLSSQVFIFADGGYVWDINKALQPNHQYGTSAGAGFRANAMRHVIVDFMLAQPFNPAIANNGKGYLRILFNIKFHISH